MKNLIFIILLCCSFSGFAQKNDSLPPVPRTTLFTEPFVGGLSTLINYDRIFWQKGKWHLTYRVGLNFLPARTFDQHLVTEQIGNFNFATWTYHEHTHWDKLLVRVPLGLNLLYGKQKHFMEVSFTLTPQVYYWGSIVKEPKYNYVVLERRYLLHATLGLGYRRQWAKGLFFRAGIDVSIDPRSYAAPIDPVQEHPVTAFFRKVFAVSTPRIGIGASF